MPDARPRETDEYSDYSQSDQGPLSDPGSAQRLPSDQGSAYDEADHAQHLEERQEIDEEMLDRDRLLHWWCQKQLGRYLRQLRRHPDAGPFRTPMPWEELGFDDYPDIVKNPMDLGTIEERLKDSDYNDAEGFINPDFFWEDVFLIWDNCLDFYEDDMEIEMCQIADELAQFSTKLEKEFWIELDDVEASMDQINPNLGSVAAYADVAACAVEDAAVIAYEDGGVLISDALDRLANWWRGAGVDAKTAPVQRRKIQLKVTTRPELRVHFAELLEVQCQYDATKKLEDIESRFKRALETAYLPIDGGDEDTFEQPFPEEKLKIPIEGLVPAGFPGLRRPVKKFHSNAGSRASSASSQGLSSRNSRNSRSSRRRDNSVHSSLNRDSQHTHVSSTVSSSSAAVGQTPSNSSRPSSARSPKMPQALKNILGDSTSEDDSDTMKSQQSMQDMKAMMAKRKSPKHRASKK